VFVLPSVALLDKKMSEAIKVQTEMMLQIEKLTPTVHQWRLQWEVEPHEILDAIRAVRCTQC
jgi:hypothetical protein